MAEQCLHAVNAFFTSRTALPVRSLGLLKKLGEDTTGTADPNGPKGYPIPYDVKLSNKSWG